MRIGVNTRLLQYGKLEGIGRFAHETLRRLVQRMPENEFIFYFDRPYHNVFVYNERVKPRIVPPPARHPFLYWLWLEWALPYFFRKDHIDVFFSPDGFLSLNTGVAQVAVIHDLAFEHFPEGIRKLDAWYYHRYMPRFVSRAKHLLAVSEFTKQDLVQTYSVPESKITVTCNGVSDIFRPLSWAEQEQVRQRYTAGKPYILYVGSIHPRKNLYRLLQAFEQLKKENGLSVQLLICGRRAWLSGQVFDFWERMEYKDEVHFTGSVTDSELARVYAAASLLCYVSLFEGFGIPILEAFASHIPVVTSEVTAMAEVASDAALLVNPYSIEEIKGAMLKILTSQDLANSLIHKGIQRLQHYSWEKATDAIYQVIRSVQ